MKDKTLLGVGALAGLACLVLFMLFVKPSFLLVFGRAKAVGEIHDSDQWLRKYNSGAEIKFYKIKVAYRVDGKTFHRSGRIDKLPESGQLDVYYFPLIPSASFLSRPPNLLEYAFWLILGFMAFCIGFTGAVMVLRD